MNTDGNLAALNAYQAEADEQASEELRLENARSQLAEDLFEAYICGNAEVVERINDSLYESETWAETLRTAMVTECNRPVMGRGCVIYKAVMTLMDDQCTAIAKRAKTRKEIAQIYCDFDL